MKKSFTAKQKLWKVMRICAVQGMMAMIVCSLAMAHNNYAQLLERKVTLSLRQGTLEDALTDIALSTNVKFYYSMDQHELALNEPLTLEFVNQTLREVLDALLRPYQIKYKVDEKDASIFLMKKGQDHNETDIPTVDLTRNKKVHTDANTITGTVTDATTGQTMAGVNVIVKGTTVGTTTDSEGRFAIETEDNSTLIFSFIGYATFEAKTEGRTVIDVILQEDIKSLDAVVVNAGYYETTKELQTGSIVKIVAKDIEKQPVSNPIAALQGRVTGLEITQQNGVPGGNFKVRIRGTNSISNGNDPLYIIDGVPYTSSSMSFLETSGNILGSPDPNASQGSSPLNSINPSDIESIEVLKDADATAIYGSRGANGVILITTKKGKEGRTKVGFNFYTGVAQVANKMKLLSTSQYVQMRKEAFANDGITPTTGNAPDLVTWDTTRTTDWQKELIGGTANITDAQVSISGGEKNTQFLISSGYHRESTVFPGENADQRISIHANITNTSADQKLKTTFSVNYAANFTDLLSEDLTAKALNLAPNAPELHQDNGELNWTNWNTTENPLAFLNRRYESTTNNLIGNSVISYSILKSLEIKANLGYTNIINKAVRTIPASSLDPATVSKVNQSIFSNSNFQNWIVEPQLNWKPQIRFGALDVLAGTTFMEQRTDGLAQYTSGYSNEALMKNIGAASSIMSATNYYSQYRYHAVFGRLNYILKDKYIINVTGRRDGSSRFGPGKQFAIFGAVGGAWVFSKEETIKNAVSFLSFGKIRASYGTTGNDQIGDYKYLDSYTSSGMYQDKIGLTPVRLYNPDFAWETNKKLEAGLELGFVHDRILLGVNYYRNRSSNQLVELPLAPTTGFGSIQGNFPAVVQNAGVEIEINTRNIEAENFTWSTSFNLTVPRNRLVEFPNISSSPAYDAFYVVGQPLDIRKLYHYDGVAPSTGVYQFTDVNDDGIYDMADRQSVKFMGRDLFGGLLNSFSYKGFKIDLLFQFVKQDGYNYTRLFYSSPGTLSNQAEHVMDRWTEEGNAEIQKFSTSWPTTGAYSYQYLNSDKIVTDASFIRLKNLAISYTFPVAWTQMLRLSNANIFVQSQNLLTITKHNGLDPETPGNAILPPLRTITAGLHLTF